MWDLIIKIGCALVFGLVVTIVIDGIITKSEIEKKMRERNLKRALVELIDKSTNVIKLKDLDNLTQLELHGGGISDDIYKGQEIYA
ncbi:MAG: hypothetical protein IJP97_00750 [Synergistaceae bacterium]|nr:hypothetical protein [Synergistaceae bacterium]MBQ6111415.1 hypothetical protein [Synergistaceae bacterium]MBQ9628833.1 hypothetical protein [Synergistaceae bacterium]MBR0069003.1 hypothetical protein [Synergistaceae bacterium]MBR0250012.1 hypothetical protein [Synergistaceae bacterium]